MTYFTARTVFVAALFTLIETSSAFAGLCLLIDKKSGTSATVPTAVGDELHLSFNHSIYRSAVEEIFTVRERGLELTQLRYSEARLVDFYGYERADFQNGIWVVTPAPALSGALNLSVSNSSGMNLILNSSARLREFYVPSGASLRVSVAACN